MQTPKSPRRAASAFAASLGLVLLSAVPASAEPAQPFNYPEECFNFFGDTICSEQHGVMKFEEGRGGVTVVVGIVHWHNTVRNSLGELFFESEGTQQINDVSRNGEPVVSIVRQSYEDSSGTTTCAIEAHFVSVGGEPVRDFFDVTCEPIAE